MLSRLLEDAVVRASERCHYQAAKWASELLNSLPEDETSPTDTEVATPMDEFARPPRVPGVLSDNEDLYEARLEAAEARKYLLAKTFFDCREYDRCAAVFLPVTIPQTQSGDSLSPKAKKAAKATTAKAAPQDASIPTPRLSQKALFLALYAKFMAGEKRKEEESEAILGPTDSAGAINRELVDITRILRERLRTDHNNGQGWLEYLYGVVLSRSKNTDEASEWLLRSVNIYPWNWSAWQELGHLIGSMDELQALSASLPQNIMSVIFHTVQRQELFQSDSSTMTSLKDIKKLFPTSAFLKTQKALLYYHAKDLEKAAHIFAKVLTSNPHRLEDLDTYSNILFVMERRAHLAFLAQLTTSVDKFRPETCCVVGNYYALKSEHEKAVTYFRRALTLDQTFLSAWTLMGHEYVELKNTQAAIECYRRAVDANHKDYRAWYGLGQTYEVLEMQMYALWYYKKAAVLSPLDPKMWSAVGSCLAKMDRPSEAITAYKRALEAGAYYEGGASATASSSFVGGRLTTILDPEVLYAIANMHDALGDREECRAYLELVLAQEEGGMGANAVGGGDDEDEAETFRQSTTSNASASAAALNNPAGVGVTATTSRARLWLTKIEMGRGGKESLLHAQELANELCQDGWEVEEAKGLIKEIRARLEIETRE